MPLKPEILDGGNPLLKPAEGTPLKDPGIYLIALRAHLNRGKSLANEIAQAAKESIPQARSFADPENQLS